VFVSISFTTYHRVKSFVNTPIVFALSQLVRLPRIKGIVALEARLPANEAGCIVQPLTKLCQISVREHLPPRERFLKILLDALGVRSFDLDITQIVVRSKRRLLAIKLTAVNAHRLNSVLILVTVEVVPSHKEQWHFHRFTGGSILKFKSQRRRREWVVLLFETEIDRNNVGFVSNIVFCVCVYAIVI
jgi:hypothetical protein